MYSSEGLGFRGSGFRVQKHEASYQEKCPPSFGGCIKVVVSPKSPHPRALCALWGSSTRRARDQDHSRVPVLQRKSHREHREHQFQTMLS